MSTFTLKGHGVPVTLVDGLSEEQLLSFQPFRSWVSALTKSLALQARNAQHPFHRDPYALRSIRIQAYDRFGGGRLGFVKLAANVSNAAGESLPGAVFLRGPSVAMLVILVPEEEDAKAAEPERYVLMTVQPRVAAGSLAFAELPAGMVDDESGNFAGAAAREIQEELGLEIPARELTCLSELAGQRDGTKREEGEEGLEAEGLPRAVFPSPGGSDEYIPIYLHERRVPRAQLGEWTGRLTGLRDEGEKITLKLVRMDDLWREGARDAKCLAALALWHGLRKEGII
ncbi:hypothetical protein VTK73DRAFT_5118 [Phialemonium thermophilum]|uniref:Nudix hydrolase domain-containing protein n=1 Tax=Phialemonium thermophilum TaxID=223376 RepID=A0ABR3WPQ6_9PEZI